MDLLPKLLFAAQQYAQLLLLAVIAWGAGRQALRLLVPSGLAGPFRHSVPLALGLGLLIVVLQGLAIAGWLKPVPLAIAGVLGLALALVELVRCRWRDALAARRAAWQDLPLATRLLAGATLVLALSPVLRPLVPPREWDELMYHLPHAWQWAQAGELTVNTWLRYPWFPYNYNLLYALALVAGNDVLPHLLHALAGWATALLLLAWARRRFGLHRALFATLFWLWLARFHFGNAYIDLGIALFTFLAFVGVDCWREDRSDGWLPVGAFALGVAVGSKYQALAMLPFFLAVAAWGRPRPGLMVAAAAAFLLPCAYWYLRNMVLAGDPVAPLGGRLFGFTDWNLADYTMQMDDLRRQGSVPPRMLWPALLAAAWLLLRGPAAGRLAAGFGLWSLLTWAALSRYGRYLLPAFPLLALLAVLGWEQLLRGAMRILRAGQVAAARGATALAAAALLLAASAAIEDLEQSWDEIAATPLAREALLSRQLVGYRMWQYLRDHPQGRIYQVGLENGIYYAPKPIWGDYFGPWRYGDYVRLDAAALRQRLSQEGFDALLVHSRRVRGVVSKPDFARHFTLHRQEGDLMLFSIRKGPLP